MTDSAVITVLLTIAAIPFLNSLEDCCANNPVLIKAKAIKKINMKLRPNTVSRC